MKILVTFRSTTSVLGLIQLGDNPIQAFSYNGNSMRLYVQDQMEAKACMDEHVDITTDLCTENPEAFLQQMMKATA